MSEIRDQEAQRLIDQTESHMRSCSELLAQHWLPGALASVNVGSSPHIQDTPTNPNTSAEDGTETTDANAF